MLRLVAAASVLFLSTIHLGAVAAEPAGYGDAMTWYEREAAKGSAQAQFLLGMLHERGVGGRDKNPAQAYKFGIRCDLDTGKRLPRRRCRIVEHGTVGDATGLGAAEHFDDRMGQHGIIGGGNRRGQQTA